MIKCPCGSDRLYASQICYHSVIVNGSGAFEEEVSIDESELPYGPFVCVECGKEFEVLC